MSIETKVYGPNWVKCETCNTTHPVERQEYQDKAWHCVDKTKCELWRIQNVRELEAFKLAHPDLFPAPPPLPLEVLQALNDAMTPKPMKLPVEVTVPAPLKRVRR